MSNEEEKRCPLCAEEMDWTDQQFKPCKCGYQVCVWCWHHIMDMAEKDETEGRCPACRTIYEKEKIASLQTNCERVATTNSNRKNKPPKAKPKTSEVQKDLTNVRVMQRKMAYVIGLPLSLADEDLLQRKEFFGQYGKVTKISLSRTAGGAIQQFVNDTCSVYVTFSKEEEAIRCIQSVHGYVLDGRFLRASFGTAKYCHAWLRNTPCNNPGCLYLHSMGAEEDSFGKDEVAAVHTRNRVHQIVGDANNMSRRSGNVLPPPVDELPNTTGASTEKAAVRSSLTAKTLDSAQGIVSFNGQISNIHQSKSKDGGVGAPNKMTTFKDVVGRPNSSGTESDGNIAEDRRILDVCSELSSVTLDKDVCVRELHPDSTLSEVPSPNHLNNELPEDKKSNDFSDEPFREDLRSYNLQGSSSLNGLSQRAYFHPSYPTEIQEDCGGLTSLHNRSHSASNYSMDHNAVHMQDDEASLPITIVNSVLDDGCHERKFQSSAKSDRIYRGSNSFSNEEIVEHLRRIGDDNLMNDENSALDVVENSIISNIMSMDFDSFNDSMTLNHNNVSEVFDNTNGHHGSSWNSQNTDHPGFSFVKQDAYANQVSDLESSLSNGGQVSSRCSLFQDFGESKDQYLYKSQFQVSKPQSVYPPGFSLPSRDPPPGFSACDRTGRFSRVSSGTHLVNNSSLPNSLLQRASTDNNGFPASDFIDPAILSCGKTKTTNGLNCTPQLGIFEGEGRHWHPMQQSKFAYEDPKFSQTFIPQTHPTHQELRYPGRNGDDFSSLDDMYRFSPRLTEQRQTYQPSTFSQLPQQKFANGHNLNGYSDDVQLRNEVGVSALQRNERLGFNKYFPGYGDLGFQMPNSGDVYTRVFGM